MAIGIGILGAGAIARVHAQGIADAGGHLVGFCDLDGAKASEAAAEWDTQSWSDPTALLSCDDVKAVVVAVPNAAHAAMAIAAMEAGRDVLLEKPMAMTVEQCREILAARDRTGRRLQVGFVCRFAATVLAARQHIEAGRLGRIYQARAVMLRRRGIPGLGRWFTDRARSGGGVLIDLGPHLVDLVLSLCGRPEVSRVSAATSSRFGQPPRGYRFTEMWSGPPELDGVFNVDDAATAMLRCRDGLSITLETAWASHLPDGTIADGVTLFGEDAAMHFDIWGNSVTIGTQLDDEVVDVSHPIPANEGWGTAFKREHDCFESYCSGGDAGPSGEDGLGVQRVLEAMYRSAEAQAEVEVSS
ncbi:MAG: Gfo/Idh/MocA family oxidoreductase [Planctomycetes bacterium]|nr:Gfo/Idh/MocA family oxidoreductase [Planctomycetota bacterium]MCP4838381.1 Gfo/Idh/MocA family oxidoreductase [Planctomycetota bacterium]